MKHQINHLLIDILYYTLISVLCGMVIFGIYTLATDYMTIYYTNKINFLTLEQNLNIKAIETAESLKKAIETVESLKKALTTSLETVNSFQSHHTTWEGWWKPLIIYFGTYAIKILVTFVLQFAAQHLGNLTIIGPIAKILFGALNGPTDFVTNTQYEQLINAGMDVTNQLTLQHKSILELAGEIDTLKELTAQEASRNQRQLLEQLGGNNDLEGGGSNVPVSDSSRMFIED